MKPSRTTYRPRRTNLAKRQLVICGAVCVNTQMKWVRAAESRGSSMG